MLSFKLTKIQKSHFLVYLNEKFIFLTFIHNFYKILLIVFAIYYFRIFIYIYIERERDQGLNA